MDERNALVTTPGSWERRKRQCALLHENPKTKLAEIQPKPFTRPGWRPAKGVRCLLIFNFVTNTVELEAEGVLRSEPVAGVPEGRGGSMP